MATMSSTSASVKASLRLRGTALIAGDQDYDAARLAWNLAVDQRPAVIVMASNAPDIIEALRYARAEGLGVAVQATGHGIILPADNSMLIVTSPMADVRIDAVSQTAWVEAGAVWGTVLEKAQAVGLAPLLGSSPGVGAVGYTLGGGLGWLARKYGLSADSVHYFELVTADGRLVRASRTENPDLFWGLRGGGGNFGIVTGMEIQLYPVSTVYGGNIMFPAALAKDVFRRYREWIVSAPDELTTGINLMNFPPLPIVPEFLRGQSVVIVNGCCCGPVQQGEALFDVWRNWETPIADSFRVMPFTEVATISNDPVDPLPSTGAGMWLRDLDDETIDLIIRYGVSVKGSSPLTMVELRQAGGAIARVDRHDNAFGHRTAPLLLHMLGLAPTPEAYHAITRHIAEAQSALQEHLTGGVYMNFMEGIEARERTRDGYSPDGYERLKALKATYDPDNLFRFGFNIPPAAPIPG